MSNTISTDIEAYVVEPLNRMLDGELSDISLDYKVSISYMDWLRKHDKWYEVKEAQRANRYTVRGMVDYCRQHGHAKELAKALTSLYLELLTAPANRMCFDAWDKDERQIRRWEATDRLRLIMGKEEYFEPLFSQMDPLTLLESCIEVAEKMTIGNYHWSLYLRALAYAALVGGVSDWDALYVKVLSEFINRSADCIKTKVEYCCLTISVAMIMQDGTLDRAGRERLLRQVAEADVWHYALFDFYSVLLDLPLHTSYTNVIQIVNRFITHTNRIPYTHLLKDCLRHNPKLLESPEEDSRKRAKCKMTEMKLQMVSGKTSDKLDTLFSVLFSKMQMEIYSQHSIRLAISVLLMNLRQQQERNMALVKQINEMQVEISRLKASREAAEPHRDSVPIADLREMFDRMMAPLFDMNQIHNAYMQKLFDLLETHFAENRVWGQRLLEAVSKPITVNDVKEEEESVSYAQSNSIFRASVFTTEKAYGQLHKAILAFVKQAGVEPAEKFQIDPARQAEWYYVLKGLAEADNVLRSGVKDTDFVRQMLAWYPELIVRKEGEEEKEVVRRYAQCISAQRKHWVTKDRREMSINDMLAYKQDMNCPLTETIIRLRGVALKLKQRINALLKGGRG